MKNINDITNRAEIVEKMADLLQQFERDLNGYQTDVYMYIDEETGAATIDTFENVGGRSWLDDDHITIYSDPEHFNTIWDFYTDSGDFAACLEIDPAELRRVVAEDIASWGGIDPDEVEDYNPTYDEILDYVKTRPDYAESLKGVYMERIDEQRPDYVERAEEIISDLENDYE